VGLVMSLVLVPTNSRHTQRRLNVVRKEEVRIPWALQRETESKISECSGLRIKETWSRMADLGM
jgi:hypothetical protein